MSGPLACPECPECGHRGQKVRFDTDDHLGVVRCADCDADMMAVAVLANQSLQTVIDPMAGELPEEVYYRLDEADRLPPVLTGDQ